jgi:hypothetical protein
VTVEQLIGYLRAVVEEHADVETWDEWWEKNSEAVRALVAPGHYFKLRTAPLGGVYDVLDAHGYRYERLPVKALHRPEPVPRSWLVERIFPGTVDEELESSARLKRLWSIVSRRMQPGDEVWRFSGTLGAGYAVVRGGVPYDSVATVGFG